MGEVPTGSTPTPDAPTPAGEAGPTADAAIVDSPPSNDPEASFNSIVKPIVTKQISGKTCTDAAPCHGGGQPPALGSAAALQAKYKIKPKMSNILINRDAHMGPALPAADAKAIADWIDSL